MSSIYKIYRPGDAVDNIATVGPGVDTEKLKLASSQAVTCFPGAEQTVDRAGKPTPPGPRCQHCGNPSFAHDNLGRRYQWADDDEKGCHCPLHPIGDGSDGGPRSPLGIQERTVLAAEKNATWTERLCVLLECYLKGNGVEVPPMGGFAKAPAPAVAHKPASDSARKAS